MQKYFYIKNIIKIKFLKSKKEASLRVKTWYTMLVKSNSKVYQRLLFTSVSAAIKKWKDALCH